MKTKLFLIGMLTIIGMNANAQYNSWPGIVPPYGGAAREGAVGFCIGSKIYIGTGTSAHDFWAYDTATGGPWIPKAPYPGSAGGCGVGFSIGKYGYVGTGNDGIPDFNTQHYYQDFWRYDTGANAWTLMAPFPGGTRAFAVGFSICDKGYVGCGLNGSGNYDDFYEYDPTFNSWTVKAPFGGGLRYAAVGFSIGDKGYVGTGYNSGYFNDFWQYDPSVGTLGTWTSKATFPGFARMSATGFSIGNKGYIGTGTDGSYLADFYEWNQATNTWSLPLAITSCPTACDEAVGVSTGSMGYICTGYNGSPLNDFAQYWPSHEPVVAFLPNRSPICVNDSCISFRDTSTTAPTTWIWSFQGGSPDTSTVQNPSNICFSRGTDTITLTAANCNYSNTTKFILSVQVCTGIAQVSTENKITIYPNPFSSETTISTEKILKDATLNIYNVFGQKVKQIQNISGQQIKIDRNGLSNGIYFIRVLENNKALWTEKVVITD